MILIVTGKSCYGESVNPERESKFLLCRILSWEGLQVISPVRQEEKKLAEEVQENVNWMRGVGQNTVNEK